MLGDVGKRPEVTKSGKFKMQDIESLRQRDIMIYGYYGAGNLGDDLLLAVTLEGLRPIFPDSTFFVRSHGLTEGLENLGRDVVFTSLEGILREPCGKLGRYLRYLGAYCRLIGRCGWLIFGGGTVFHEQPSPRSLLLQWIICLIARLRGARIAALGVGVSDLRSVSGRWFLRRIIGMSELFLVRDTAALRQCQGDSVHLTGDLVFAWSHLRALPARPIGQARVIAVTVCPPAFVTPEARHRFIMEMAATIRQWRDQGRRVVFLIFQRAGVSVGDELMCRAIASESAVGAIEIRDLAPDWVSIASALADVDIVCGMRFHALVLAAISGLPFVGLAHDNKIDDICQRFAMPALAAFNFTESQLMAAADIAAWSVPDAEVVDRCTKGAELNFSLLRDIASP